MPKAKEPNAILTALCTVWTFLSLVWMVIITYVVIQCLYLYNRLRSDKISERDECYMYGKAMRHVIAFLCVDLSPFWSMNVHAEVPLEELPTTAIYMVNHASFADPFLLCSAQRPVESKYAGKGDFWNIPLAGTTLRRSGDMPVHFIKDAVSGRWRTKKGNSKEIMDKASYYLDNDIPLTVFPEGSVSAGGELLPFKRGFFDLAITKNCPIIPVGMWGTQIAWPNNMKAKSGGAPFMNPADMHVHFGAPISSKGKTAEELMEETFHKIQNLRNGLPNFDVAEMGELAHSKFLISQPTKLN